jgi:hypothetical protein
LPVKKRERVLLVVAGLTKWGRADLRWLYKGLDVAAVIVAKLILGLSYRRVHTLSGKGATAARFVERLAELAADERTQAIDVLLHLHGKEDRLLFADGPITTAQLGERIAARRIQDKLRMLYSTACYGADHASDFVEAGFRLASGAIAVNANSIYDYPAQLLLWALGKPYRVALSAGNRSLMTRAWDRVARRFRFQDVDSRKIAVGDQDTSITSEAV